MRAVKSVETQMLPVEMVIKILSYSWLDRSIRAVSYRPFIVSRTSWDYRLVSKTWHAGFWAFDGTVTQIDGGVVRVYLGRLLSARLMTPHHPSALYFRPFVALEIEVCESHQAEFKREPIYVQVLVQYKAGNWKQNLSDGGQYTRRPGKQGRIDSPATPPSTGTQGDEDSLYAERCGW